MFETYYEVAKTILAIFGAFCLVAMTALAALGIYDSKHPELFLLTNDGKHRMNVDEDRDAIAEALHVIH